MQRPPLSAGTSSAGEDSPSWSSCAKTQLSGVPSASDAFLVAYLAVLRRQKVGRVMTILNDGALVWSKLDCSFVENYAAKQVNYLTPISKLKVDG